MWHFDPSSPEFAAALGRLIAELHALDRNAAAEAGIRAMSASQAPTHRSRSPRTSCGRASRQRRAGESSSCERPSSRAASLRCPRSARASSASLKPAFDEVLLWFGGRRVHGGDEALATSTASVELDAFTEEAVAARLGAGWTRAEAGVLERRGDDGSMQRVAVGRRGLDADVARFRAELDRGMFENAIDAFQAAWRWSKQMSGPRRMRQTIEPDHQRRVQAACRR